MLGRGDHLRRIDALGQQLGQRRRRGELCRLLADDLVVGRLTACAWARASASVATALERLASAWATSVRVPSPTSKRERAARTCSDRNSRLRSSKHRDLPVTDYVHVCRGGVEQGVLLGVAQLSSEALTCALAALTLLRV